MHIDAIVTDMHMPGKPSGIQLVKILRQRWPTAGLIVMSGYSSSEFMAKWPDLGIDEFIAKPFDMVAIRHLIKRVLSKKSGPDQIAAAVKTG